VTRLAVATLATDLDGALLLGPRALSYAETNGTAALASAALEADALVLGKLQREETLRARSSARFDHVVRRATTGTEAQLRGATLYHALALPRVDTLFPDATARTLLNRNLRAILRGYTAALVPLRYFGTEVLALLGHPVALVGYDQSDSGAVLIEVLVGLQEPCVVRPALKREAPSSLYGVMRRSPPPEELLGQAVHGIVEKLAAAVVPLALPEPVPVPAALPEAVVSSVQVPLGVVEACATPSARITGDLLASTAALRRVEALIDAGNSPNDALTALHGAPLDGARPTDLLQALTLAFTPH